MNNLASINKQQGAALIVGLILLVVITVLAISGMNTATTELAMARNDQNYENAFQAAETGLEQALSTGGFNPGIGLSMNQTLTTNESVTIGIGFEESTPPPDGGFSLGGNNVLAWHFIATSEAASKRAPGSTTDRDSTATHTQAFYIVGPNPGLLNN